jgi:subtilisin family serine protease
MTRKWHKLARTTILAVLFLLHASAQERYILRAKPNSIGDIAGKHGLTILRSLQGSGSGLFVVQSARGGDLLLELALDPAVQDVERDMNVRLPELQGLASPRPPDTSFQMPDKTPAPYFGSTVWKGFLGQPAAEIIHLAQAQQFATGSGTVAFLDTGVDLNHPGFGNSLVAGYDFVHDRPLGSEASDLDQSTTSILDQSTTSILDRDTVMTLNQSTTSILDSQTAAGLSQNRPPDAFGHGTMVAGLIHLVAPTASLMPVKVFADDGSSSVSDIINGIYYAVDHGARVINMSFSTRVPSQELMLAINYANSQRVICVASVGNDGQAALTYPAGYRQVIGMGSTNNVDLRSSFSNYGDAVVSLAAPGEGVITFYPGNNYAAAWGTSFSTPLAAGAAALLVQMNGNINAAQALQALSRTAVPIGQGLGAGRADLLGAAGYQNTNGNGNH